MKILFVVHRYFPYPGGPENYVRDMAEETHSRGHEVSVFTGIHKGDQNGIKVSSDPNILHKEWDLIVVHGGNVPIQDFVLNQIKEIQSPVMFMLISPSQTPIYLKAMQDCTYLACSTQDDRDFAIEMGYKNKLVQISHGINTKESMAKGVIDIRKELKIQTQ